MKQILIIDDEITIRTLLERFLSKKYDVVVKQDGLEAMSWLQEGNIPDLILADLEMPEYDGRWLLENIKSSNFFKDIPLAMLSGVDESKERISCLRSGAKDFILKPFNPEELDIKIDILLNR